MGPGGKWSRLGNGLFKPKTQKRNNPMPTSDILKVCEHIIIHPGGMILI